jgi:hypothetical protein
VSLSDSGAIAASELNTLDLKTSGVITAASATSVTGSLAAVNAVYASTGITGLGSKAVLLSDSAAVAASELNTLDGKTSGVIDASGVTGVIGSLAAVNAVYASSGITGLGNKAVTLSDSGAVAAVDLSTLDLKTSGVIDASGVTGVIGSLAAVNTVYASTGITGLSSKVVTLTDNSVAARELRMLDASTTGAVDAKNVLSVTGLWTDVKNVYSSKGIVGLGDELLALTDKTSARIAVLSSEKSAFDLVTNKSSYAVDFLGDEFDNVFVGFAGNDTFFGGRGSDILTGGSGADTFIYKSLGDSTFSSRDRITDFAIGVDRLFGPSASVVAGLGRASAYTEAGISAVLTSNAFAANSAAAFTIGVGNSAQTFLAMNDGLAGFQSGSDSIVEITGFTGSLSNLVIY